MIWLFSSFKHVHLRHPRAGRLRQEERDRFFTRGRAEDHPREERSRHAHHHDYPRQRSLERRRQHMKLRLLITTPKGQARESAKKLQLFLLGVHKPASVGYDESSFYWELDCSYKSYVALTKRVLLFQQMCNGVMEFKMFKKAAKGLGATDAQMLEVKGMLTDGTRVEIIKNAEAEEIISANMTMWEKLKAKFKRAEDAKG